MLELNINGELRQVDAEPETPLLWVLREQLGLTGTKFGCGVGQCGACTVHFNGQPMRSCLLPVVAAVGSEIRTIEDLDHPLQRAWIAEQVPQCGYCQSGQLMAAAALLERTRTPSDQEIDAYMSNICRCATYDRIRKGIKRAGLAMEPLAVEPLVEAQPEQPAVEPPPEEPRAESAEPEPAQDGGAQ